jgi:large subunit ribosomal protein L29
MKMADMRELSLAELEKKIRDTRQELLNMRLGKKTGQLEKPHLLKEYRRLVARLETVANAKRRPAAAE